MEELHIDLSNVVNDRVSTKRVPTDKYNYLVILKDTTDDEVPYYILRTQEKSVNARIALLKKKYTTINEIFRIYTPNVTKACISIFKSTLLIGLILMNYQKLNLNQI